MEESDQAGWGEFLEEDDCRERMKRVLGFQVRSSGAPGPLTLKEVEELEQLTQQLMQDMEHPQRQNVAVNGELTASRRCPAGSWAPPPASRASDPLPRSFLLLTSVFSGLSRVLWPVSSAPGTHAACSSGSGAVVPHHLLYLPPV